VGPGPHPLPVADTEVLYVVQRLMTWDTFSLEPNLVLPFKLVTSNPQEGEGQPVGFLPVFRTLGEAAEWADDGHYDITSVIVRRPTEESDGG